MKRKCTNDHSQKTWMRSAEMCVCLIRFLFKLLTNILSGKCVLCYMRVFVCHALYISGSNAITHTYTHVRSHTCALWNTHKRRQMHLRAQMDIIDKHSVLNRKRKSENMGCVGKVWKILNVCCTILRVLSFAFISLLCSVAFLVAVYVNGVSAFEFSPC